MRKLLHILLAAAVGLLVVGAAQAATFDAANSALTIRLAGLPPISVPGNPGGATSGAGPVVTEFGSPTKAFGPVNVDLPDSLFTGVPQIADLRITGLDKPAGTGDRTFSSPFAGGGAIPGVVQVPGGGFGGIAPLSGQTTICVYSCGFIQVKIPLTVIGQGGTLFSTALGKPLTVQAGAGWTTGLVAISGINTEQLSNTAMTIQCAPVTCPVDVLVTGTGNGVFLTEVTLAGTNNLTANGAGTVTLVTPVRTNSLAGALPLFAIQQLAFLSNGVVPEPGTLLLLGSGVAGLLVIGRRKMRG